MTHIKLQSAAGIGAAILALNYLAPYAVSATNNVARLNQFAHDERDVSSVAINPVTGLPVGTGFPPAVESGLPPEELRRNEDERQRVRLRSAAEGQSSQVDDFHTLQQAGDLSEKGQYAEALELYRGVYKQGRSSRNLSSFNLILPGWVALGGKYPPAREALLGMRNRDMNDFTAGRGSSELFQEVVYLNSALPDEAATVDLFKSLDQSDPALARGCYGMVQAILVQRCEYVLCWKYLGDFDGSFLACRDAYDSQRTLAALQARRSQRMAEHWAATNPKNIRPQPSYLATTNDLRMAGQLANMHQKPVQPHMLFFPNSSEWMSKMAADRFVQQGCELIEILAGSGHKVEAERIRDQALALLDDPQFRSATARAEKMTSR